MSATGFWGRVRCDNGHETEVQGADLTRWQCPKCPAPEPTRDPWWVDEDGIIRDENRLAVRTDEIVVKMRAQLEAEATPPFCQLCADAADTFEALQEMNRSTLCEMLVGWHGYRGEEVLEPLSTLIHRLRESGTLRDADGNRSIFDDVDK